MDEIVLMSDPKVARAEAVLGTALASAGLVNYPSEWWHWSYGDRYWALATGTSSALYGPCPLPRQGGSR